mgnify:CR=1 FL=1
MRGAWIEIRPWLLQLLLSLCRSPCGERGLKSLQRQNIWAMTEVAPHAGSVD